MISAFRRGLDTWVAKAFFIVMVLAFVFWGVGDVVRMIGSPTWVFKAGSQTVEGQTFQAEFQRAMAQASRNLPAGQDPSGEVRRKVGDQTLDRMAAEIGISEFMRSMRIVSPDASVAEIVRGMPAFRGADGKFSKATFDRILRDNSLTEQRFMQSMRSDVAGRQFFGSLASGTYEPTVQAEAIYRALNEKRSATTVLFRFDAAPKPPEPTAEALQRWYDNHPDLYSTPEYRRIKAIVLSPAALSKEISISDEELQTAYTALKASFVTPEKRSAQIVSVPDEAKAKELADAWRSAKGDAWATIQEKAKAAGATAIPLDEATKEAFPDPDLAQAVFSAQANNVVGPVKAIFGWYVLQVVRIQPGSEKSFDAVKNELRDRVLAEKATDIVYARANTLDNLLGNGTNFEDLPGDLGLVALAGTLDSGGDTPEGKPAPLPDTKELRSAILEQAFQVRTGDQPRMTEVKTNLGPAYFAVTVEEISPAAVRPYASVAAAVGEDWRADQRRKAQEKAAADMLAAIKGGRGFDDAATLAGVVPKLTPRVGRSQADRAVPTELHQIMFGLKKSEPAMVETADGFLVAAVVDVQTTEPASDPAGFEKMRIEVSRNIGDDVNTVVRDTLRQRANLRVNQTNFDQIVQP